MGARETTPPTTQPPRGTSHRTPYLCNPTTRRLFLAPDDPPPLTGLQLVRPRRYAAPGAPAGPRTARRPERWQLSGKSHQAASPSRRPQQSHRARSTRHLTARAPMGAKMPIGTAGSTDRGPGRAAPGTRSAQAADQARSGPQLAHRDRERSAEPLPNTPQTRHPAAPARGLTWGFVWQVLGSNQRRLSRRFYIPEEAGRGQGAGVSVFGRFRAGFGHAGRRAGVKVERPAGRTTLRPVLLPAHAG